MKFEPLTHYTDWQGIKQPVKFPKGNILAQCGDVSLVQTSLDKYAVVYGLEVTTGMPRQWAANSFGNACIHQAECHSLTK